MLSVELNGNKVSEELMKQVTDLTQRNKDGDFTRNTYMGSPDRSQSHFGDGGLMSGPGLVTNTGAVYTKTALSSALEDDRTRLQQTRASVQKELEHEQ